MVGVLDFEKFFIMQRTLNDVIVKEKRLEDESFLSEKILALMVELGELANELPEEFKFWSNKKNNSDKALVEYVDGLHLILTIGLEVGLVRGKSVEKMFYEPFSVMNEKKVSEAIRNLIYYANKLDCPKETVFDYHVYFCMYLGLAELLGFSWNEVETAFMEKNKINLARQDSGY